MYKCHSKGLRRELPTYILIRIFEEHENVPNTVEENEFDRISSICNDAGIAIDENNDLWDYLEAEALFISKTWFMLKTQFIPDTGDNLPQFRQTFIPITNQQLHSYIT